MAAPNTSTDTKSAKNQKPAGQNGKKRVKSEEELEDEENKSGGSDGSDDYVSLDESKSGDGLSNSDVPQEDQTAAHDEPDGDEATKDLLPGAAVMMGIYDRFMELGEFCLESFKRQENEQVREFVNGVTALIEEQMLNTSDLFASLYPDLPELDKAVSSTDDVAEGDETKSEDDGEDEKKSKSLRLPFHAMTLSVRLKRVKKQISQSIVRKRMSKGARSVCNKAAAYLDEMSDHEGELKSSQQSAAAYHARALKELAQAEEEGEGDSEEMKRLRTENGALKKYLSEAKANHDKIVRTVARGLNGR